MMMKKSEKRKKGVWNNDMRRALCLHHEENPNAKQAELMIWLRDTHGCIVSQGTISNTLRKGKDAFPPETGNIKRQREAIWPDVEQALYEWVLAYQASVVISGDMVKAKAALFYEKMYPDSGDGPQWSNGWLFGFQSRRGIKSWKRHGEAASVSATTVAEELPRLQADLAKYNPSDIHNMDETGLFFKLQPDTGLSTVQLAGTKKDKTRLTLVVCSNMTGDHKLPLWVVGKFKQPRALRGVNMSTLGCVYDHSGKAWMNGDLFLKWLAWFDQSMRGRKVILLLDNASCHTADIGMELKSTTLRFLPPNTTSVIQPLDQGIIRCLKAHYRKLYYNEILARMESVQENREETVQKWSIYDAICTVVDAWSMGVSQEIISNCWAHARVRDGTHAPVRVEPLSPTLPPQDGLPSEETDVEEQLSAAISRLGYANRMNINFLLNHPDEQVIEAVELPTDEEIIQGVTAKTEETQEDLDDMETVIVESEPVRPSAALASLRLLEQYVKEQSQSLDSVKAGKIRVGISLMRTTAHLQQQNSVRQTSILDYFGPLSP